MPRERRRRVCFVTGTRAEFGLMASTLRALREHESIDLKLIATGMHTHASRGHTLREIRRDGWTVDAVVPWADDDSPQGIARATGIATAKLATHVAAMEPDVVLVVGDRVEAFAAATAVHLSGRVLAHVHGGDRAMGQVDDALRHAISKLAHVHLCATRESGERLYKMGEQRRRIHVVGAPGIDGIRDDALDPAATRTFLRAAGADDHDAGHVLVMLHPTDADDRVEALRTAMLVDVIERSFEGNVIALLPNSDPGSSGMTRKLRRRAAKGSITLIAHAPRPAFLGLLRDSRALIGNSSSGIIEAGSFGTPVVDVGPRQQGRERGSNVGHVSWDARQIATAVRRAVAARHRRTADNPYDRGGAAGRIVTALSSLVIDAAFRRKVIRY